MIKKSMLAYLKIEKILFFREPLQVIFSFFFPPIMFTIFASVFFGKIADSEQYFNKYIPGYFTTIIYIVAMFMVGHKMIVDKEKGIYKRLKVTPFNVKDVYVAMVIRTFLLCIIGSIEILTIAKFVFSAKLTSSWSQFLLAFLIGNVSAVAMGFFIFSICKTSKQAISLIIISFYPFMMLGDNAFPLSLMPDYIQKIAPIMNPIYHLNMILRASWKGELFKEYISLIYVLMTIIILFLISYKYSKNEY